MKKTLSAVLAVAFLSSPAFAAEQNAQNAPSAQDQAAQDKAARDKQSIEEQREKQFIHETHASPAKKQTEHDTGQGGMQGGTGQGSTGQGSEGQGGTGAGTSK